MPFACYFILFYFYLEEKLVYFHDMEHQKEHFGPGFESGRLLPFSDSHFHLL